MGLGPSSTQQQQPTLGHGTGKLTSASSADWLSLLNEADPSLSGMIENGGVSPESQQALGLINQLTSGPIGSSPATAAGMRAYTANAEPAIEQASSLSGGGRGGALTSALTQGQEQAYDPLIQQEISNRESAIPQLTGIGNQAESTLMSLVQGPAAAYGADLLGSSGSTTSTPGIFSK
jgi:hypothetical protein